MFSSSRSTSVGGLLWRSLSFPSLGICHADFIFALLFIILSYNFPKLLESVIPLSFEHFPFVPFPLYTVMMLHVPSCHSSGISSVWLLCWALLGVFLWFLYRLLWIFRWVCYWVLCFCSSLVSLWQCWFLFHRWSVVVPLFLCLVFDFSDCVFDVICPFFIFLGAFSGLVQLFVVARYVIFGFLRVCDFSSVFHYRAIGVVLLLVFYLFFLVSRSSPIWSLLHCTFFILAACLVDSSISFLRISWLLVYFSPFSLVPWLLFLWLHCILCVLSFTFLCILWLFHFLFFFVLCWWLLLQ